MPDTQSSSIAAARARRDGLFEAFDHESDRGLVLVGAAFMDEVLEHLLRELFSSERPKPKSLVDPLFDGFGPLASFSAKTRIAYALDLIPRWIYDDLELIRKLRNHVAHSVGALEFDNPKVMALTGRLVGADHAVTALEKQKPTKQEESERLLSGKPRDRTGRRPTDKANMERMRLVLTLSYIGGLLQANEQIVRQVEMPRSLKSKILRVAGAEVSDT